MNLSRLSVLPKFVKFGDPLLVCKLRNAGKYTTQVHLWRTFQTHSRNLAYAKDLFLGQLNKVNEWIYGVNTWLNNFGLNIMVLFLHSFPSNKKYGHLKRPLIH